MDYFRYVLRGIRGFQNRQLGILNFSNECNLQTRTIVFDAFLEGGGQPNPTPPSPPRNFLTIVFNFYCFKKKSGSEGEGVRYFVPGLGSKVYVYL